MNKELKVIERPEPIRIGDHPALDFLNTIAAPVSSPVEWLACGDDLINWLLWRNLIGSQDADLCRQLFSGDARDGAASEARAFRDWLRGFVLSYGGAHLTGLSAADLEPLNALLADGMTHQRVVMEPSGIPSFQTVRRWSHPNQLLQPIAEAAADLICHCDFKLIRRCEGRGCTLVFLDRTKSHRRRWCSMDVCGNRCKAAAHRARQLQSPGQ